MLKLWWNGRKLSASELRATPPMKGRLQVMQEPAARHGSRHERAALLMPLDGSLVSLAELHVARLTLVNERGLILSGIEESFVRKNRVDRRQAWWCWPLGPGAGSGGAGDPGTAAVDEGTVSGGAVAGSMAVPSGWTA